MFPEWYQEAERLYVDEKLSYTKIGQILGVGRKTVSHYLRKGGHESNLKFYPNVDHSKYRKYQIDESVFETIDTEEKAYWLGMLYADGNVSDRSNDIEVTLQAEDYNHLLKLRDFFKTDKPVYKKDKKKYDKTYEGYRLIICSKKIKQDLIRLGCLPRKSHILQFPTTEQVPEHLMSHFVRGYFDGDGCITFANKGVTLVIELLGTEDFLTQYLIWSERNHHRIHDFKHSKETKRVQHFGEEARFILNRLYVNANVYLERKYNLYKNYALPSNGETH